MTSARSYVLSLLIAADPAWAQSSQAQRSTPPRAAPASQPIRLAGEGDPASRANLRISEADRLKQLQQTEEALAELYEQKNDTKRALDSWRQLLRRAPSERKYLLKVCRLAHDIGHRAEALTAAQRLMRLSAQDPQHRQLFATVLVASNRYAEALPHLKWLVAHMPGARAMRRELVFAYLETRQPAAALGHLDQLLRDAPQDFELRIARADALGSLDRTQQQLDELQKLKRLFPERIEVVRQLVSFFRAEARLSAAEALLQQVVARDPGDKWAVAQLARVRNEQAVAEARRAAEQREAERYHDWQIDLQHRSEDF